MDFQLTEEQSMLRQNARNFLEKEIVPAAAEYDKKGPLDKQTAKEFIKRLIPFGYYTGGLPEEYGGSRLDMKSQGILVEELARAWGGLCGIVAIAGGFWLVVELAASQEMKEKLLPLAASGDLIGCVAITEPNVGSDPTRIETTAILDGDDYVVNGTKTWISNGGIADTALVLSVTDRELGPLSISFAFVEKEKSPFTHRELHKVGLRAWSTAELSFDNCRVPRQNILEPGTGYRQTIMTFDMARAILAVMSTGIAQAALDAAIRYAREREQFGSAIGRFQMIQEMIADMIAETEAGRLLAYRALDLNDRGERCRWQSSLAKAYATEAAVNVTSKAVQIHGAMGLSDEYPVERYFRDARVMTIPDGTTQIQKLIIAREALGIKAFG